MRTACPYHTDEIHAWTDKGFFEEVRRRGSVLDFVLIAVLPVAVVLVHGYPDSIKASLAFRYGQPTLLTAYTANFVHQSWPHLVSNLIAYLLIVPLAYLLSLLSNRRRHFRVFFLVAIGAGPFVVSLAQLPFVDAGVGMGSSGLVMVFFGYASLIFVGFLASRLTTGLHLDHAPVVFFVQVATIGAVSPLPGRIGLAVTAGSLSIAVVYLGSAVRSVARSSEPLLGGQAHHAGYAETAVFAAIVIAFNAAVGFSGVSIGGSVVNPLAHFVGFASGFLVAYVALRTDCALSHAVHCAGPDSDCRLHDSWLTRGLQWVWLWLIGRSA